MASPNTVDAYLERNKEWEPALSELRRIIRQNELEEHIKWGQPVYSLNGKNVLGIGAFKRHFGIWFFNGALLDDPDGLLVNAQKAKTQAMRQLRYTSMEEIDRQVLQGFIDQAIKNQKAGREVKIDTQRKADIPPLLQQALDEEEQLQTSFEQLSPGRQRDYAEYIRSAKQDKTKARRLEKILPMIRKGLGLNDAYNKS